MSNEIEHLHRRMDAQDALLLEIRDKIVAHIALEAEVRPAIDELVALWKGSKVMSRIMATLFAAGAAVWALFVWARDHIK